MEIQRFVPPEVLAGQIAASLRRGYPEIREALPQLGSIRIVANGPSAEMGAALPVNGPVMALNRALGLYTLHRRPPMFWVACDPQASVASMLRFAPRGTHYLVASQCHPDVFAALRGRDVALWHVHDPELAPLFGPERPQVHGGISVTSRALSLAHLMGWHRMEVWGWDCCRIGGRSHAVAQPTPNHGDRLVNFPGPTGPEWDTSDVWLYEAAEAVQMLRAAPYQASVEGPGLLAALLREGGRRAA